MLEAETAGRSAFALTAAGSSIDIRDSRLVTDGAGAPSAVVAIGGSTLRIRGSEVVARGSDAASVALTVSARRLWSRPARSSARPTPSPQSTEEPRPSAHRASSAAPRAPSPAWPATTAASPRWTEAATEGARDCAPCGIEARARSRESGPMIKTALSASLIALAVLAPAASAAEPKLKEPKAPCSTRRRQVLRRAGGVKPDKRASSRSPRSSSRSSRGSMPASGRDRPTSPAGLAQGRRTSRRQLPGREQSLPQVLARSRATEAKPRAVRPPSRQDKLVLRSLSASLIALAVLAPAASAADEVKPPADRHAGVRTPGPPRSTRRPRRPRGSPSSSSRRSRVCHRA